MGRFSSASTEGPDRFPSNSSGAPTSSLSPSSPSQPFNTHFNDTSSRYDNGNGYNTQQQTSYSCRLPSPNSPLPNGFGRPPPPSTFASPHHPHHPQQQQHLLFSPYNFLSSPSSPSGSHYGTSMGLPAFEGASGHVDGRAWSPFPGSSPYGQSYGPLSQAGGYYPTSTSSAASSPGGGLSTNSFDPRGLSPSPSSAASQSQNRSSSASSSSRYRHQPPPQQHPTFSSNQQNLRPPFSPYQHRSPAPPPTAFYPPNSYPPPPASSHGSSQSSNTPQPHTVQGPDGQMWAYVPVPISQGFYAGRPFDASQGGGAGGPPSSFFPGRMGPNPFGGQGGLGVYGYGGAGNEGPSPTSSAPPRPGPFPPSIAPSSLSLKGPPFPTPFSDLSSSTSPHQTPSQGSFSPLSPSSRLIPTGPSSVHSHTSSSIVRKPYHPPSPQARSEFVMWAGNVPSDATQDELSLFFNGHHPIPGCIASVFNISRSQCCFVNFRTQEALESGIQRFNGMQVRPEEGPRGSKLVCRVRRKEDDLKAGVGGQRGRGVHTGYVREKQQEAQQALREKQAQEGVEELASIVDINGLVSMPGILTMGTRTVPLHQWSTSSARTSLSQASTDSSFLAKNFPIRYFIVKSLTSVDLETSVRQGLWATQVHNEQTLDQAFRTSKEVILIFGANKTGEFFGYAKMASGISKSDRQISWASRESSGSLKSPSSPSRAPFSPSSHPTHPAIHHQRSAPERIVEDVEDEAGFGEGESSDPVRSVSNPSPPTTQDPPTSITLPSAGLHPSEELKSNGVPSKYLIPDQRDSPGEISPGEDASLGSDMFPSSTKPVPLLNKVLDRDGRTDRVTAPAELESRASFSPNAEAGLTLDPKDLGRLSLGAPSSSSHSPTSPSSPSNLVGKPSSATTEDDDGVKRADQFSLDSSIRSFIGSPSASRPPTSVGSRGSFTQPNLHLPPSPTHMPGPGEGGARRLAGGGEAEGGSEVWGTPFKVEWIKTTRLPFHRVRHLRNPWNQDREVKVSRDGTEVEPEIGRLLLSAWDTPISPPSFPSYLTAPLPPGVSYDPTHLPLRPPPPHQSSSTPPMGRVPFYPQRDPYVTVQWGEYGMGG